ncbi:MAG: GTPase ObgE [Chloroflexi bacterium]|nr:GTPase ObgE [Chloroflexota bacterium]
MIDRTEIRVQTGRGGDGSVHFRREKFVPYGGPDGGDGGAGGSIIIQADIELTDLTALARHGLFQAENGQGGRGKKQHGKNGSPLVLKVPVGTFVSSRTAAGKEVFLADLANPGQNVEVAKGGKGGWGNVHFTTPTSQAPRIAQKGELGEEKTIVLEMRLIADVGIIGYPNVGKSTLLAAASSARPKIGDYPFTTREPILGMVEVGEQRFTLAEIPGLIEGAHLGRGLGYDFLRHAMRTKLFIHLVDGSSASPIDDMITVNNELRLFEAALSRKPQLVAVNKIDLPGVQSRISAVEQIFREARVLPHFVSAVTKEGVPELMAEAARLLKQMEQEQKEMVKKPPPRVFRPAPVDATVGLRREGEAFVLSAPEVVRMASRMDMSRAEARRWLEKWLGRRSVTRELEKAGMKAGDTVRCGAVEWRWGQ